MCSWYDPFLETHLLDTILTIDSVPQAIQVAYHHGDAQTNKPSKRDGRVVALITLYYKMLIRTQEALPLARILIKLFIFKYSFKMYGINAALRDSHQ